LTNSFARYSSNRHPTILMAPIKSRIYRLTQVHLEKWPLKRKQSVCMCFVFVCVPGPALRARVYRIIPRRTPPPPLKSLFPSNQATKTRKLKHFGHTSRHNSLAKDIMLGPIVYYLFI